MPPIRRVSVRKNRSSRYVWKTTDSQISTDIELARAVTLSCAESVLRRRHTEYMQTFSVDHRHSFAKRCNRTDAKWKANAPFARRYCGQVTRSLRTASRTVELTSTSLASRAGKNKVLLQPDVRFAGVNGKKPQPIGRHFLISTNRALRCILNGYIAKESS